MNAPPSPARRRQVAAWYVHNATLMLNRYLMQPDQAHKANLMQFLDDYANAVRRGDVELPMLRREPLTSVPTRAHSSGPTPNESINEVEGAYRRLLAEPTV